jgi:hypothetical protein
MGHPGRLHFRRDPGRIPGLRPTGRVLKMDFNFNIGAVKVAYETSGGLFRELLIYSRIEFDYIQANHTLIEAHQTTKKAN